MRLPSPRPCIPSPPVAGRQKQALGLLVGCSSSCHLPWGWWSEWSKRNVFLGEELGSTSPVTSHSSLHYSFPFTNTLPSTCISIQLLVPSPIAFHSSSLCSFPARFCSNHTPSFNTTSHPYHSSPLLFPHCFPLFFLLFFPLFIPLFQVVPPIAPPSPSLAAVCLHCSLSLANTLTLFPHPSSFLSFVFAFLFLIFTTCHHHPTILFNFFLGLLSFLLVSQILHGLVFTRILSCHLPLLPSHEYGSTQLQIVTPLPLTAFLLLILNLP